MTIIPAIDIKDSKVVRLIQGDFNQITVYSDQPAATAQKWADQGADWLHVVDLDGAQQGRLCNMHVIQQITKSVNIPIQVGGGIRTKEDIIKLFESGVARVVLGTKIIEDEEFLVELLSLWPERVGVALDCKDGYVAEKGWSSLTTLRALDFAKSLEHLGLKYLIYTDIKRDGMLCGPNWEGLREILSALKINVIASGGISQMSDIEKLLELNAPNLYGAITGKAIYEGSLDFNKAVQLCLPKE